MKTEYLTLKTPLFKKWLTLLSTFMAVSISSSAWGSISGDLKSYFDGLGVATNSTVPQAYKGQQAGYYTGGSLMTRNTVRNVQIASIKLPSYNAGCGGIDLHGGAISFVNGDEMVAVMRSVMSNAGTYAFSLMLESVTPQIANTVNRITDMANKVNQTNINSCESAAALVGGLWPKTQVAQRHVCADIGTRKGIFADYALARQGCGQGGATSSTLKAGAADEGYESALLESTNFAWKAIMANSLLKSDADLAALFMSLSGSIIFTKADNDKAPNGFSFLPPLAMSQGVMTALLEGGPMQIYQCDTSDAKGCLNPTLQTVTIEAADSLTARVNALLTSMVNHLYDNSALTDTEIGFLNATRLPVYKMLAVQAAYSKDDSILEVSNYAELIATDLLFQYLDESLRVVSSSASSLQAPQEILTQFQQGIHEAAQAVRSAQSNHYQQMNLTLKMIEETQAIEQLLAGQLSTELAGTLAWSRSVH